MNAIPIKMNLYSVKYTDKTFATAKDSKAFMKDLKTVYKAVNEEEACNSLQILGATCGEKYPIVIDSWNNNWENLSTYFIFPPKIRKIIYTNNALEGFNRQLRKFTKIRTTFLRSDSLMKALYLATDQIMAKWSSPSQKIIRPTNRLSDVKSLVAPVALTLKISHFLIL